jgi:hypothetical protein
LQRGSQAPFGLLRAFKQNSALLQAISAISYLLSDIGYLIYLQSNLAPQNVLDPEHFDRLIPSMVAGLGISGAA